MVMLNCNVTLLCYTEIHLMLSTSFIFLREDLIIIIETPPSLM